MTAPADRPPDELQPCKRCGRDTEHRYRWHVAGKGRPGKWRAGCLECRREADKRYNGSRKGKRRTTRHRRDRRRQRKPAASSPPPAAPARGPTAPELAMLEGFPED